MKTNATRTLDRLGIRYELREYEVDPQNLTAESVAGKIGLPSEQVFKTLVLVSPAGGVFFAVVPGDRELDLKALARLSGERKLEMAPLSDLQKLTGYIRGGVTALAARKNYPVYLDGSAFRFAVISVSAGVRGTQILLDPKNYARAVAAVRGEFSQGKA